jgi:hypothetical protein
MEVGSPGRSLQHFSLSVVANEEKQKQTKQAGAIGRRVKSASDDNRKKGEGRGVRKSA